MSDLDGKRSVSYIDIVTRRLGQTPETRAEGGYIAGPGTATSDSIPAYLSNGEYVIKAAAVDHYGSGMFDRLNAMHFASGSKVDPKDKKKPKRGLVRDPESDTVGIGSLIATTSGMLQASIAQMDAAKRAASAADTALLAAKDQDEAADKALSAAQSMYDSVQSQTAGLFNIDPLAQPDSMWGSASDPFSSLQDIIDRSSAHQRGSTALSGRGSMVQHSSTGSRRSRTWRNCLPCRTRICSASRTCSTGLRREW